MKDRCIEVSSPCSLEIQGGCLHVIKEGEDTSYVELDRVSCFLITSYGVSFHSSFLRKCGDEGVPLVVMDEKYVPKSITLPISPKSSDAPILIRQARTTAYKANLLWRKLIRSKVQGQICNLEYKGRPTNGLIRLLPSIDSGDTKNVEAQAARIYWSQMFNDGFQRFDGSVISCLLNYGYTILYSCFIRRIVGLRLSPTIGVHHTNTKNPAPLASDLMEPFRPLVDRAVCEIPTPARIGFLPKKALIDAIYDSKAPFVDGIVDYHTALDRLVASYRDSILNDSTKLELPRWCVDG